MTRDQFIRRVSDVLQRSDVSDAALLVRMLEVNCFGSPHSAEDGASTVTLSWNDITPALTGDVILDGIKDEGSDD